MDQSRAEALLQLSAYRLDANEGFQEENWRETGMDVDIPGTTVGDRSQLKVKEIILAFKQGVFAIAKLDDDRIAVLWEGHGTLFPSMDALVKLCKMGRSVGNNGPHSPLNNYEFSRLQIALEG